MRSRKLALAVLATFFASTQSHAATVQYVCEPDEEIAARSAHGLGIEKHIQRCKKHFTNRARRRHRRYFYEL